MKLRRNLPRVAAGLAVLAALVLTAAGCGDKANEPFRDAPRSDTTNSSAAEVIEMPDGFNNLASKCDGPNRVYVTYHGDRAYGSVAVVPNDPRCTRGGDR
ncbi:MAG: hypothetical protein ACJ73S_31770 [Mycobacteriales bacterium]